MARTHKTVKSSRSIALLALTGLMLTMSIGASPSVASQPSQGAVAPSRLVAQASLRLPRSVQQAVRQAVSQQFNIPTRNLKIVRFSRQTWSDGCLGLGGPAEGCLLAQVRGWRVEVTDGKQTWIYRTNNTGSAIRLEPQSSDAALPTAVRDRLLRVVARQVQIPAAQLRIAEVKSSVWDGCLGIYKPGQACTRIAISGWQAIVTGNNRSWVYHLDETGSRIAQNPTASGSRGGLVPSFIPEANEPAIEPNVVFRLTTSGDLAGRVTQTTLTTDGTITQFTIAPNIRSRPVVLKRLSQEQVAQFQQVLQELRFRNLNGLRYLSSAALADYPTTTLQGVDSTVQYVDLEKDNFPQALQQVIQAWEKLQ